MNSLMLAVMILAVSIQFAAKAARKSSHQPVPEAGFWIVVNNPAHAGSTVHFYANSNYLITTVHEPVKLNISKLSVRKYLNKRLASELAKDSSENARIKLYEIN